jgi:hypothetical protein
MFAHARLCAFVRGLAQLHIKKSIALRLPGRKNPSALCGCAAVTHSKAAG